MPSMSKLVTSGFLTMRELEVIQTLLNRIRSILRIPLTCDNLLPLSADGVIWCQLLNKCGIPCQYDANPQHAVACRTNLATCLQCITKTFGIPSSLWFEVDNFGDTTNIRRVLTFLIHFAQHPDVNSMLDRAATAADTEFTTPNFGCGLGDEFPLPSNSELDHQNDAPIAVSEQKVRKVDKITSTKNQQEDTDVAGIEPQRDQEVLEQRVGHQDLAVLGLLIQAEQQCPQSQQAQRCMDPVDGRVVAQSRPPTRLALASIDHNNPNLRNGLDAVPRPGKLTGNLIRNQRPRDFFFPHPALGNALYPCPRCKRVYLLHHKSRKQCPKCAAAITPPSSAPF